MYMRMKDVGMRLLALVPVVMFFCLSGCGSRGSVETEYGRVYDIYYVNNEETRIFADPYQTAAYNDQTLLDELLVKLAQEPEKGEYKAPLAENFELIGYTWDGGQLTLNFDEHYKEMDKIKETLVRAAIVRTLSQVGSVNYIAFTIQNEPLVDSSGVAIGMMSADTFIDNTGNEINTYEKVNLRLYFANENGDMLVEENQRNVVYSSNVSLEKLIVEKLIEGPSAVGSYPTINPATKVISVTVNDRICYVNLDESFLSQPYNVTNDVTIYSIANSLVELSNVNKVQISINGETNVLYKESVSLTNIFERNLDLVESAAPAAE